MSTTQYTKDHEWVRVIGDHALIGISDYAQSQLGDIVFVELPDVGASLSRGDEAAVVESVKAASEIYAPVSGDVVETNDALAEEPSAVNSDPTGGGWFFKIKLSDTGELELLMSEADYTAFVEGLE